jgi:membrane-associated phospholipid phosphatase
MPDRGKATRRMWLILLVGSLLIALFDGSLMRLFCFPPGRGESLVRAGYWLGHGSVVLPVLLTMWLLALIIRRPALARAAGLSILAFILSGMTAQVVKHLVGRPRPRLWAEGATFMGPTFAEGFNSFPSGHTATSMAVAVVLSWYCPRGAPVFFTLASFVAASRLLGGSHFPIDILGGVALGLFIGGVAAIMGRSRRGTA